MHLVERIGGARVFRAPGYTYRERIIVVVNEAVTSDISLPQLVAFIWNIVVVKNALRGIGIGRYFEFAIKAQA